MRGILAYHFKRGSRERDCCINSVLKVDGSVLKWRPVNSVQSRDWSRSLLVQWAAEFSNSRSLGTWIKRQLVSLLGSVDHCNFPPFPPITRFFKLFFVSPEDLRNRDSTLLEQDKLEKQEKWQIISHWLLINLKPFGKQTIYWMLTCLDKCWAKLTKQFLRVNVVLFVLNTDKHTSSATGMNAQRAHRPI